MNVLDIKNDLLRLVVETDDAVLLDSVRKYFKVLKKEPVNQAEITAQEARMINLGLKQLEEGKVMSNEEVRKKIKADLRKKQK